MVNKPEYQDYTLDGLTYCGKCNTPKEMELKFPWGNKIVFIPCKCEEARIIAEGEQRAKEKQLDRIHDIIISGCFDRTYLDYTLEKDDGRNAEISELARKYVNDWERMKAENIGLLLYGNPGTGKTFIAAAIANDIRERYADYVLIAPMYQLIEMISGYGYEKDETLEKIRYYPLLVIDDLGVERSTEYAYEKAEKIIDERLRSGKPLIITSNIDGDDFLNPGDIKKARIYSRLKEMCVPTLVDGEDRRGKTRKGVM